MTTNVEPCAQARSWLSAVRDGEARPDDQAATHLDACTDCRAWSEIFDRVTRITRLRAPRPDTDLRARVAAFSLATPADRRLRTARTLLAIAAAGSLAAIVLAMAGVAGHLHLGSPEGRDAEALMLSLAGGYALTAWRPARLAAGLLPVAVLAALVITATSLVALANGDTTLASEVPHLPILLGGLGTTLAHRATLTTGPAPRGIPAAPALPA